MTGPQNSADLVWAYRCIVGPQGPTGPAGVGTGSVGPTGPRGATGAQGVTGAVGPVAPSPWSSGQATDEEETATTSSAVIGAFSSVHSIAGLSGESAGAGEVTVVVEDSGVCLGAQVVGFSFQSVGGGAIVAGSKWLYGYTGAGIASVQADGSGGVEVVASPTSGSSRVWSSLLRVTGRNHT